MVLSAVLISTFAVAAEPIYRETGFVETEGERIYYESFGEGEAVVLCHGLGGNHAIWYQQVPVLAQDFRVITWDQRGFGRSTNAKEESSPKTAVRDLLAVLDHLGIERAHLIGQSMGGWAVTGFALAHPDRVASLVLADTIGGIYTPAIEANFDAYIRKAMQAPPPADLPITEHPALGEQLGKENAAKAFLYSQIASNSPPAPSNMGLLLRTTQYPLDALRELDTPTLFVAGENDPIFPVDSIEEAAGVLPNASVEILPDAGHSPYFETPEAWNEAVLAFLSAVSAID